MKLLLQQQPRWFSRSKACSRLFFFVIFSLQQSLTDFVTAERMLIGYSIVRLDVGLQILCTGAQLKDVQDFGLTWLANDNTILPSLQWSSTSCSSTDCTQIRRMHKSLMIPFLVRRGWESNWGEKKHRARGTVKAFKDMVCAWWYVKMIIATQLCQPHIPMLVYCTAKKKQLFALRNFCNAKVKIITHTYKTQRSVWQSPSAFCCHIVTCCSKAALLNLKHVLLTRDG